MSDEISGAESAYEDKKYTSEGSASQNQSDDEASVSESDINSQQRDESVTRSPRKRYNLHKKAIVPPKRQYNEAYRTLYNDTVEEICLFNSTHDKVPTTQIGLSIWTSTEKEVLFQRLASLGKDNVRDLATAIGSKSEAEVRQYILLLDQGLIEGNVTHALPVLSAVDLPAAFEASTQSESVLEEFADGLSQFQQKSDQRREKKRHADYWLLTEEIAAEVEEKINARFPESEEPEKDEPEEAQEQGSEQPEGDTLRGQQRDNVPRNEANDGSEVPAAELLNLPTWLRLSQFFMYQPAESEENWTNFIAKPDETPSMYHTAFQDFHNLTVSITRRLVQASIFQAMTRLRTRDKHQPTAVINSTDIRNVADMMGMKRDRQEFWRLIPRKHGLTVWSSGRKHSKGQSRSGVELSFEDVETALGVDISGEAYQRAENEKVVETVEEEIEDDEDDPIDPDYFYRDSELWSDISDDEKDETVSQNHTNQDDDAASISSDDEDPTYRPADDEGTEDNPTKKRRNTGAAARRALQKAHDTYIEAFDREMSRVEEIRIWDMLNVPPPEGIKDEEIEIPRPPATKRTINVTDWREDIDYESHWERGLEPIKEQDFADMQRRGESGRKRRRLAYEHLEKEGLVELTRSETDAIKKITRQEKEARAATAAAVESMRKRTMENLSKSQSPRSLQRKSRGKSKEDRSGPAGTPMPEAEARVPDGLAAQMAKRLAHEKKQRTKEERSREKKERREARKKAEENGDTEEAESKGRPSKERRESGF